MLNQYEIMSKANCSFRIADLSQIGFSFKFHNNISFAYYCELLSISKFGGRGSKIYCYRCRRYDYKKPRECKGILPVYTNPTGV